MVLGGEVSITLQVHTLRAFVRVPVIQKVILRDPDTLSGSLLEVLGIAYWPGY